MAIAVVLVALLAVTAPAFGAGAVTKYTSTLAGFLELPPNASPATGATTITLDLALNTLRVQVSFSGLLAPVTVSHIHGPTVVAGVGNAGVMTTTPTFTGFPSGVTAGTYDNTFDLTLATSFNPSFVTNSGGLAAARTRLINAIQSGQAYLNIHSVAFPGGEIRGFLTQCVTACGDPHFHGLDGSKYDFQGEPGNTYALISDPTVQLNSLFVPAAVPGSMGNDFLGPTCLAVCGETVEVFPNRTVLFNNRVVVPGAAFGSNLVSGAWSSVGFKEHNNVVKISVPNWDVEISMSTGWHVNIDRVTAAHAQSDRTHGVLGHTLQGKVVGGVCNVAANGGCEVVGNPEDYVVPSLCSTQFHYSQFDRSACY